MSCFSLTCPNFHSFVEYKELRHNNLRGNAIVRSLGKKRSTRVNYQVSNENSQKLHIVDDYIMPNYLWNAKNYRELRRNDAEHSWMTFKDDKNNDVEISYCDDIVLGSIDDADHMDILAGLGYDHEEYRKWCENVCLNAAFKSPKFNVEIGKQMLSWLYLNQCCLSKRDIPAFIEFAKAFEFRGFKEFFASAGIYPTIGVLEASGPRLYYHTFNIPHRDLNNIMQGFHLSGSENIPDTYYHLELVNEESSKSWKDKNKYGLDIEFFNSLASLWTGPVLEVSVPVGSSPSSMSPEEILRFWQCFLNDMRRMSDNSLILNKKKSGERMHKLEKPKSMTDDKAWNRYFEKVPKTVRQGRGHKLRLQIMVGNEMKKAWSMLTDELKERCIIADGVSSFFFGLNSPKSMFTAIGDVEALSGLLMNLEKIELGDSWCAVELQSNHLEHIVGRAEVAGYNLVDKKFYVMQPSTNDMVQFLNNSSMSITPQTAQDISNLGFELHLFELLPDQTIQDRASQPHQEPTN